MFEFDEKVIEPGNFLIATPALRDPNFHRSVILICDHDAEGSFGLVVNRSTQISVEQVLEEIDSDADSLHGVQFGGPVDHERIFALRKGPLEGQDEREICPGVFIPEDLQRVIEQIRDGDETLENYRFFLGYTGWGAGQLAEELDEKSWIVSAGTGIQLFETPPDEMWSTALRALGGEQILWSLMPPEPDWN